MPGPEGRNKLAQGGSPGKRREIPLSPGGAAPSLENQRVKEHRIGIRELKSRLSQCIREVKMGATIVVTDRGRPVARIVREGIPSPSELTR